MPLLVTESARKPEALVGNERTVAHHPFLREGFASHTVDIREISSKFSFLFTP
jgi:hypothetical protein